MSSTKRNTLNPFPRLTIAESAELTGVSKPTIRRMIADGELRAYRFGRSIRIDEADLSGILTEVNPVTRSQIQAS